MVYYVGLRFSSRRLLLRIREKSIWWLMAISTIFKVDENGCKKQLIKYVNRITRGIKMGKPKWENKGSTSRTLSSQDKKDLRVLADDFGLLHRKDVQDIIQSCKSYSEGQQKIMRVYTAVYL